jgi:hypothetical protein
MNKQCGTWSFPPDGISNSVVKMVSSTRNNHSIQSYFWDRQYRRLFRKNNWMITPATFAALQHHLGQNDIDLFADRITKQLPKYVSWFPDLGSLSTDAFTTPWNQFQRPYLNPRMKLNQSKPSEDYSGETSISHYGNTLVAQCALVPYNLVLSISSPLLLHQSAIVLPSPTSIWPMTNST